MHPIDKAANKKQKRKKKKEKRKKKGVHAMIVPLTLLSFESNYTLDSIGGFIHSKWYFFNTI
jgi:hypothetical protein